MRRVLPEKSASSRCCRGLTAFLHDFLQDVPVQREIDDQVLSLEFSSRSSPQLTKFAQTEARILLLPDVEGRFADPVLAADVRDRVSPSAPMQRPQQLFLRMSLLRNRCVLVASEDHACRSQLNIALAGFSGFGSQPAANTGVTD